MNLGIVIDEMSSFGHTGNTQQIEIYFNTLARLMDIIFTMPGFTSITLLDSVITSTSLNGNLDYLLQLQEFGLKYSELLMKNGWNVRILGRLKMLDTRLKKTLMNLESLNQLDNTKLLQICLNYTGRNEIIRAIKMMNRRKLSITQEHLENSLDSNVKLDVIVYLGGVSKSNDCLIWQSTNSYVYFTERTWLELDRNLITKVAEFWQQKKQAVK